MYSPKISEDLVRALYQLKLIRKLPMTRLVDEALREYIIIHSPNQLIKEFSNDRIRKFPRRIA